MTPIDLRDDDRFIEALGDALAEIDPVPESVKQFGRGARGLISLQAELAEVLEDTLMSEMLAMRSVSDVRTVRFGFGDVEIEIELGLDGIVGSVDPFCDEVVVVTATSRQVLEVNRRGIFRFGTPDSGFRLECEVDGVTIRTPVLDPR